MRWYEGHPICYDNGLISQKLLFKSEVYYPLHMAMGVDNLCVKYEVFITTWYYAIQICKQHSESLWPRKIAFLTKSMLGLVLAKDVVCFFGKLY